MKVSNGHQNVKVKKFSCVEVIVSFCIKYLCSPVADIPQVLFSIYHLSNSNVSFAQQISRLSSLHSSSRFN